MGIRHKLKDMIDKNFAVDFGLRLYRNFFNQEVVENCSKGP